ncbi:hypothetical protein Pla108_13050 [Botrimarina colliarenosi]|uniref:PEP-CTERM protein-sorting domain-containing protein n=1 Tax=Botrimarina colliarenosi TaxID=2528001 RepID=A0A5C6AMK5_9BACT|nr:hypothetical protein [Botrimarina colliarenosi]TWU00356.1 hypothetical protein Pla108_13050 [Botrimarina colliarenosi]
MGARSTRRIFQRIALWCGAATLSTPGVAATVLFAEDFNSIPLLTSPTYGVANAYSLDPPPGWDVASPLPPGGIPEWRGWSFARKTFWQNVGAATGDRAGREFFKRGDGTVAVADPDLWNSPGVGQSGDPANRLGFFNSFLTTPVIDLDPRLPNEKRIVLGFDSSWLGVECCDDGAYLDPSLRFRNNQTAIIRVRIDGDEPIELLRWESAPFRDANGFPTDQPISVTGAPNTPNPYYRAFDLNERHFVDLTGLLPGLAQASDGSLALAGAASGGGVQIEFGVEDAGDDGWWAIDNVELASYATVLGDMNLSGDLDVGDYDAFALGMLDTNAYRYEFFGEFPVTNGSLDSVFDFDDIPWFMSIMEGVGAPATAYAQAFFAIPEPSAATLALFATLFTLRTRRHG